MQLQWANLIKIVQNVFQKVSTWHGSNELVYDYSFLTNAHHFNQVTKWAEKFKKVQAMIAFITA